MSDTVPLARCGKEEMHLDHEHPAGWCDGGPTDPVEANPGVPLAGSAVYPGLTAHPRPWAWASLTVAQARDLRAQLDRFVAFYNATLVVEDKHLVLGCWPLHPGLAHDLAALHAVWVEAMMTAGGGPQQASAFYDRWLPGFQHRLPRWYGINTEVCKPGRHREDWNPSAAKRAEAGKRTASDVEVEDAVRALVGNPAHMNE